MGVALCLTDWNNYLIRCGVSLFVDKLAVGYHLALSEDTFGIFLWRHATVVLKAAVEVGHVVESHHIAHLCNVERALAQQIAGAVYTQLVEICDLCLARSLLEEGAE